MAKVLPTAEHQLLARLLENQANQFFIGAKTISEARILGADDAEYFLKLMSAELYFKLIYLLDTESLVFGHDVREIYDLMPRNSRRAIFQLFNENLGQPLELDDFREWLRYLSGLFVKIRYPFEEFREMSLSEYEERIRRFAEADADDFSEASIVYHQDRVLALLTALRAYSGASSPGNGA